MLENLFDDFESEESDVSQSLSIFNDIGDVRKQEKTAPTVIDRRKGETSSVFGEIVKERGAQPKPTVLGVAEETIEEAPKPTSFDKFNAAAAKRSSVIEPKESTQNGKRTLQPRSRKVVEPRADVKPKEISVTDAVKSATHDIAVKQSARRAENVRQPMAQTRRAEQPAAQTQPVRSARAMATNTTRAEKPQMQARNQRTVDRAEPQRIQPTMRRRADRPLPERQTKKRANVAYTVVDEMQTSCPGGGVGFFKRTVVGMLNGLKCKGIERKFRNAKEFKCKPFKFRVMNGEAMITSYSGDARVVEFPSYIRAKSGERIPVCYIHSSCLYSNFLNNYRTKNAIDNLTSVDSSFKLDGQNKIIDIKLPEGLKAIFDDTFDNCLDITAITIPSTVQFIGNNAFRGSTITKLFFNGPPISNWTADLFPGKNVYVMEQYADLY